MLWASQKYTLQDPYTHWMQHSCNSFSSKTAYLIFTAITPQSVTKTKALRSAPHGGISLAQAHPPTCALPNKDQTRPQDPTCRMRREQRVNGSFSDSITATGHFQRRVQADYDGVSDKMLPERSGNRREVEAREIKRDYC